MMSLLPSWVSPRPIPREPRRSAGPGFDLDARVVILGAGATGLTVARALTRQGYRHVTVLERDDRVGGKCSTFVHEGLSYELGAVALTTAYPNVRALARELGIKATASASCAFVSPGADHTTFVPPVVRSTGLSALTASCVRLGAESVRYRALRDAGLHGLGAETAAPFREWARERGVTEGARLLVEPLYTPLGYGYMGDVPAAYVLKLMTFIGAPFYELLGGGYQGLWEAAARGLDVRRQVTVRRIRRGEEVVVETDREAMAFDALVLTSPRDEALRFLDATPAERELASKIRYFDYRVVAASVAGLPAHRYVYLPENFEPESRGEAMLWYKRWRQSDVAIFYAYGREGSPMSETTARVSDAARRVGGTLTEVHRTQAWRYFPHVSSEDMAAGFYDRLEALQGTKSTFYAGELLGFGTVEGVMSQALDVARRHFQPSSTRLRPRAFAA